MSFEYFKKIIVAVMIFGILINPGLPLLRPKIAEATLPVVDLKQIAMDMVEIIKRSAGQVIKKAFINRFVNTLIRYINRGFKGGIVFNWNEALEEARQGALGELLTEAGLSRLCSPYNLQLQLGLVSVPEFDEQLRCTLTDLRNSMDDFLNDFRSGGWLRYGESWAPNNNYFGSAIMTWNESIKKEKKAAKAASDKLIANQGYKGEETEACKKFPNSIECRTIIPGSFAGKIFGEAGSSALITVPTNSIINANDINGYVNAIADAAINQLVIAGTKGLQNLFIANPRVPTPPADPCSALNRPESFDAYRACRRLQGIDRNTFVSDKTFLLSQIDSVVNPRKEAANVLDFSINTQTLLVDALKGPACSSNSEALAKLNREGRLLADLENQFDDNQDFLDDLGTLRERITLAEDASDALIDFNYQLQTLDVQTAQDFLASVKEQNEDIQKKVSVELSPIQASCTIVSS